MWSGVVGCMVVVTVSRGHPGCALVLFSSWVSLVDGGLVTVGTVDCCFEHGY